MGKEGKPNVVVMGAGEANLDPSRKARDEALAREAKARKLPPGVGAANPNELSTNEDLEKEIITAKVTEKFSELFDWKSVERLISSSYASQATQRKLLKNLEVIKKSLVEIVQAAPQSFSSLSEAALENVIKMYVKNENDEMNSEHKILHSAIEKKCQKKSEPEKKTAGQSTSMPAAKTPDVNAADGRRKAVEAGRFEQRVNLRKKSAIDKLERIFKKEDLKPKDKEDAVRFKNEKFRLDNFKIRFEDFSTKKISVEQKKKLEEHRGALEGFISQANLEIERKIQERRAEIDEFLASIADKDKDEKKSAVPTMPEVPVVEKIPTSEPVSEASPEPVLVSKTTPEPIPIPEPAPEPEPKKSAESPEEKEIRTRERKDRLAQIKNEVEQTRKEYAEMDYKKKKAWNRLKSFMPSLFKNQREEDQDVAFCRARYDNKLFEYKNFLLEDAKENGLSGKELGDLVRLFTVEANLNMADTHTEVKIEHHEGKISGKLKNFSSKMIENYRKLPITQKLAIGAAFLGMGTLTSAVGIGVGAFATATALRRFFMGAVTGTGIAVGLEMRGRGKTEQNINKEVENFTKNAEGLSDEKKYEAVQNIIDQLIYDEDQKINKIKNTNLRNLVAGVGVGSIVGSGAASEILRGGWHKITGVYDDYLEGVLQKSRETLNQHYGMAGGGTHSAAPTGPSVANPVDNTGVGSHTEVPAGPALKVPTDNAGAGLHSEAPVGPALEGSTDNAGAGLHSEAPVGPALENPINLEIKSGSSLEGTIIKSLKDGGMGVKEAGTKAHLMAMDYAKEKGIPFEKLNKTFPGQDLKLSPDGTKIINLSGGEGIGPSLEATAQPGISSETAGMDVSISEAPAENIGSSSTEGAGRFFGENAPENEIHNGIEFPENEIPHGVEVPENEIHHGIEVPENGTGEFSMSPEETTNINAMEMNLKDLNFRVDELDDKILKISSGQYESVSIWPDPERMLDDLREQKQILEQARERLVTSIYSGYVGLLRKLIYGGILENVEKMGKMPAAELLDNKKSLGYKFFARVMDSHSPKLIELQRHISPLNGEGVDNWIMRVAKIMKTNGIKKI